MTPLADRFAGQAWSRGELHLAEAEVQNPETTPHAIVHAAYYAMFHAARAAMLRTTGSASKKHGSVASQFGPAMKDRGDAFQRAGDDLKIVQAARIRADYGDTDLASPQDARDSLRRARAFLDICAKEFGFPRKDAGRDG